MNNKELLLSKIDIVDLISEYVDLKKTGSNYKGLSPFKEENTPSFIVSPTKKIFKDFSSNYGGDAIKFYSLINNIPYSQALYDLSKKYGVAVSNSYIKADKNDIYYTELEKVCTYFQNNLDYSENAKKYLEARGYTKEDIKRFRIGFANEEFKDLYNKFNNDILIDLGLINQNEAGNIYDFFVNRITFPIYNLKRKIVGFGARDISNNENIAKYLNSKETKIFKKGEQLFGLFDAGKIIKEYNSVILVEGFFDVLSLHKNGITNTVASLGTALTEYQAQMISKLTKNIVIAYDDDTAGTNAKIRSINILNKYGFNIKIMSLDGLAKDPDEYISKYGKASFVSQYSKSIDALDFLYNLYSKDYDINKSAAKMEIIAKLKEYFNSISNKIYFEDAMNKLARKLSISIDALNSLIRYNFNNENNKVSHNNNTTKLAKEKYDKVNELELYTIYLLYNDRTEISNYKKFKYSEENQNIFNELLKDDNTQQEFSTYEKEKLFEASLLLDYSKISVDFKLNLYCNWVEKYIKDSLDDIFIFNYNSDFNKMTSEQYIEYIKQSQILKKLKSYKNINKLKEIFNKYLDYENQVNNYIL